MTRKWVRKFRKRYVETSLNGQKTKDIKICTSHVNVHQRVTAFKEDFNKQVDRKTCSVDTSQPLSLATLVMARWTQEQSDHGGRDGSYAWAQQHGLPLTKANLCPIFQQQRLTLSLQYGTIPQGGMSPANLVTG